MMRESSPPEAILLMRPSASPAFAEIRKRTLSAPGTLKAGRTAERCDLHVKAHGRHGQLAQFTLDLPLERGGGSPARLRQFRRRCARLLRLLLDHRFELLQPVACVFDLIEPGLGRFKRVDQPRLIRIVFPLQTPEQRQARFDAVKFLVGKV